jgi:Fe2+ or Zn2+ uptake regulation protein
LEQHNHFYCNYCKIIIDFPIKNPIISEKIIQKLEISVEGFELSLTGLCSKCKQKTGEKPKC